MYIFHLVLSSQHTYDLVSQATFTDQKTQEERMCNLSANPHSFIHLVIVLGTRSTTVNKKAEDPALTDLTFEGNRVWRSPAIKGKGGIPIQLYTSQLLALSNGTLLPHVVWTIYFMSHMLVPEPWCPFSSSPETPPPVPTFLNIQR